MTLKGMSLGTSGTPGSAAFSDLTGDPEDNSALSDALALKADLVGGVIPLEQLPAGVGVNRVTARVATTGNVTIATALNNGDTIDGVVLATNDVVLVGQQTAPAQNGIYVVAASPARHTSYDAFDDYVGLDVIVSEGSTLDGTYWSFTVSSGGVLDTSPLTVTQTSNSGLVVAANNLSDLASATTARTNLGVAIGSQVQAYDADLAAIAALAPSNDDVIQRKAGAWTNRSVAQYLADLIAGGAVGWVDGTPTGGADGDIRIGITKPEVGFVWIKDSGTWGAADNSYTWAGRPSAASYTGRTILITDWDQYFKSNGTDWIPMNKRLILSNTAASAAHGESTESAALLTQTFPAGLILAGCKIRIDTFTTYTGTTNNKTMRVKLAGTTVQLALTTGATQVLQRANCIIDIPTQTSTKVIGASASATGFTVGTTLSTAPTVNFANATDLTWTLQMTDAADEGTIDTYFVEVLYR
jgi:hypothetical protein